MGHLNYVLCLEGNIEDLFLQHFTNYENRGVLIGLLMSGQILQVGKIHRK